MSEGCKGLCVVFAKWDVQHAFVFAGFTRFCKKNIGQEKSPDLREEDSGLVVKVRQCLVK
jgi:hypothetical protein